MERPRRLFAIGFVLVLLLAVVPAPAAAADVTLTVTVETEAGDSVAGAELTATWDDNSTTATTFSNGKAFIDVPDGETVELTVEHDEYMRNSPLVIEEASGMDVTMTVHPISDATISVQDDGETVDDALVTLSQDGTSVVSERTTDGTIATGEIEAGTYTLAVEKAGYYSVETSFEVPGDESVDRAVELDRGSVTLQVNVTDPYFDPPRALEGITVTVDGEGSVNTQSNGQQQLSVPVNTDLTVRFEAPAYETVEQSIETGEESISLAVELDRANDLNVTVHTTQVVVGQPAFIAVTDEYDDPVVNATVLHNGDAVTETDGDGWARLPIETAGTHEIQVDDGTVTSNVTEITAVTAETTAPTETTTPTETETEAGETETTSDTTGAPIPGFGPLVALFGIALGIGVAVVGRRSL
ncbi:PGF-CTERM sorting domain-containing protein [Halodesulfurarchaeum sp.]|uniref:PGF-CTERM sorting domain-containing protein n=1 Tax=Halodesulfurarchaeum sp. TaxID=1980530 RepID=UPI001BC0A24C|nr:PGF-CTERM sorting domain-containing protein [Halodesulfurarchaeum sp.]